MLLRYIRGKCEPAYPALYSVLYKLSEDGPIYDGIAKWMEGGVPTSKTTGRFGEINRPNGGLVKDWAETSNKPEVIAFFQFPGVLQEDNYVELREKA